MGFFKNSVVIGEKKKVTDYNAYTFYRKNAKHRKVKSTPNFIEYGKIITSIYKKTSNSITEYEGGVYANNFFYITGMQYPKKNIMKTFSKGGGMKDTINTHSNNKTSTLLFINLISDKKYWAWGMDYMFYRKLRTRFSETLRNIRPNYKFVLDTIIKNKK